MTAVLMPGRGGEALNSQGIFGGYPGCNTASMQFRNCSDINGAHDLASTQGEKVERFGLGVTDINANDIQYVRYDGSGGYGDPLDREPDLVLKDLQWGLVTDGPARDVYGVVVNKERTQIDEEATHRRRLELRTERLNGGKLKHGLRHRANVQQTAYRISEYLQVTEPGTGGAVQCTWCGERICNADTDWKKYAVQRKSNPSRSGPLRVDGGRFFLLEFFCPGCGTTLDVDVTFQDDPPLIDRIENWPKSNLAVEAGGVRR
jgi:N-methylhydantoinase B